MVTKNNGTQKVPCFLCMAIDFEKSLIGLCKSQIASYENRVELMKAGLDYQSAIFKVPAVRGIQFDWQKYFKLRNEYMKSLKKEVVKVGSEK